jgi:hypothetical protein
MGFFSFLNGDDQRSDIRNANKNAMADLTKGYNTSKGYYDQASSSFDPYVSSGTAGQKAYADLLGLNGEDARTSAQGVITSDPLWSGKFADDTNAVLKNLNARGMGASGAAALAGQRVLAQDYGNVLDRYANLGNQGLTATGQKANVLTGQGDNAYGFGATKANQDLQFGNAMSQTRNTGLNNVLSILGTGAKAYAAYNGVK